MNFLANPVAKRLTPFLIVTLLFSLACAPATAAPAPELGKHDSALKLIPEDVAFFHSFLRNREQIEAIGKSKAWAKLMDMPVVQLLSQKLLKEWENESGQLAPLAKFYAQPENRELVEVVADLFSHEVFIYGGQGYQEFSEVATSLYMGQYFGPLKELMAGNLNAKDAQKARVIGMLQGLNEVRDKLKVPELTFGFKVTKIKQAQAQLKRLETLANGLAGSQPLLKGRVKKQKVNGAEMLVLELDGSMVPWDSLPLGDLGLDGEPGEYKELFKKLSELKLRIAIGLRDDYLLFTLAESVDHLAKLGKGKRLIDRDEFKPLAPFASQKLTSIGYVSKAMHSGLASKAEDLDNIPEFVLSLLPEDAVPKDKHDQLQKDLKGLAKDLKAYVHEGGASLSFSFLTPRGTESYIFEEGDFAHLDGSKPLTILDHLGGTPLLAAVQREKYDPKDYKLLVKWIKIANGYVEDLAIPKLEKEQREQYDRYAKIAHPLLKRLDKATETLLLPALADGQSAFVLDGKLTSKQWHVKFPPNAKALPILEPALVYGVSDAGLLRKAAKEYRAIFNDLIVEIRKENPEALPDFQIPEPKTTAAKSGGDLYYYELPPEWGLELKLAPCAGLSKTILALTISGDHADRLLTKTPLKLDGGPLADAKKPRLSAFIVNPSAMMDALSPWVDLLGQLAAEANPGNFEAAQVIGQVHTALDLIKVFRFHSSSTYLENGKKVTHAETVIKDLE